MKQLPHFWVEWPLAFLYAFGFMFTYDGFFKMNELWENLYKAALDLSEEIEDSSMVYRADKKYLKFSDALDAIIEEKNKEAFNK